MQKRHISRGGFALPTVLIASVVMLTILAVSVSSVAAVRTTLKTQYYEQLAKAAGEAGVAFAKACLAKSGNVPLWTDTKPLRPSTDCAGNNTFANNPFRALVVAGGGSGGGGTGGGGGAGGVIAEDYFSLGVGSYSVVVGAGGAASGNQAIGRDGANSSFNGFVAEGGGGGGYSSGGTTGAAGRPGGSGGGGQRYYGSYGPGAGTLGQGNDGGSLTGSGATSTTGGGGAGGPGLMSTAVSGGGNGGPGIMSTITGAVEYYGGGGGGGSVGGGACGTMGGGDGGIGGGGKGGDVGAAGRPNTGGGGGGGWCYASGNGGAGGSGIVIIAYPKKRLRNSYWGTQVYDSGATRVHVFKSGGTFSVSSVTASSCPTDPRCSVTVNDTLRSSFSVAKPAVDAAGRALTIPNSGYVELLRATTGEVWRTYRQPSVQVAAVPDLCSGAASSGLGWQNAVLSAAQEKISTAPTAQTVTLVDGNLAAGNMYFRKDFAVTEAGVYNLAILSTSQVDTAQAYIDGTSVVASQGSIANSSVNLSAGCHTITVQLTNKTLTPKPARFTAAVQRENSTPIVATGTNWRVSAGSSVHFSQADYYADPSIWGGVNDYQNATAQVASAAWQTTQQDIFTRMITPIGSGCSATCPAQQSGYMRDSRNFYVSTPTEVQVSTLCDDDCSVYLDGEMVIANSPWSAINQQTMTITPGPHRLGVRIYNAPATAGPSGAAISVVEKATGKVLARTDRSWQSANVWTAGLNATTEDIRAYEESFRPSPDEIPRPKTFDFVVVAGGGGGGGNCATCGGAGGGGGGGVIFQENVVATTGSRTVTVGAGGAAGVGGASRTNGGNGGNSVFGTTTANGGGGGGAQLGTSGLSGGSGGGGSGGGTPAPGGGGAGISGQGFAGGVGVADPYSGGGGGGAGGAGVNGSGTIAGNGGAGLISYITGSLLVFGSGGGAAAYAANYAGASDVGAGDGVNQNINLGVGYPGTANTGGGGGGGNGSNRGGAGGAGGSGVVIIRVKTGSMTVSTTGSPSVTNATINGVAYTIYRYNANGTFNITSL